MDDVDAFQVFDNAQSTEAGAEGDDTDADCEYVVSAA